MKRFAYMSAIGIAESVIGIGAGITICKQFPNTDMKPIIEQLGVIAFLMLMAARFMRRADWDREEPK